MSDYIYNKIIEDFENDHIKFGEKIIEVEYAKKFEVSRTPLREAIKKLENEGLIIRLPNGRLKVIELDEKKIIEIFNIRIALENMLLKDAMLNPDTLNRLKSNISLSKKLISTGQISSAKNTVAKFGKILYSSLSLEYTVKILSSYNVLITKLKNKSLSPSYRIETALDEHEKIYTAISNKDYPLACKFNEAHIIGARDSILKHISFRMQ